MSEGASASRSAADRFLGWGAIIPYALVIVLMLPSMVVVRSDDFGYLESTISTLWQRWPVTGDWLEPNNALFAGITALAQVLTGNFYLATFGVLSAFAVANFALLNIVVREWSSLRTVDRQLVCLALVTTPVYLDKSLDFVGVIPAMFFVLAALACHIRRGYGGFFVAVMAGFMVREDAIVLLALPAGVLFWTLLEDRSAAARLAWRLIPGIIAVIAGAIVLKRSMNATYWQIAVDYRTLDALSLRSLGPSLIIGFSVAFLFFLLFRWLLGTGPTFPTLRECLRAEPVEFVAVAVLAALSPLVKTPAILFDLPQPDQVRHLTTKGGVIVLVACASLALALRRGIALPRRSPLLIAQIGLVALISLHQRWWDYYFLGIVLLSFLLACESAAGDRPGDGVRSLTKNAVAALCAVLLFNAGYGIYIKFRIDRAAETIRVLEPMIRDGELAPGEIANAPFGYDGWNLYRAWFAASLAQGSVIDTDFLDVFTAANVTVDWRRTASAAEKEGCSVLRRGEAALAGLTFHYAVNRCGPPLPRGAMLDRGCRFFPLTTGEWDLYIRERSCEPRPFHPPGRI